MRFTHNYQNYLIISDKESGEDILSLITNLMRIIK